MKTILGYHDKNKSEYGIIKGKLPVLVDEGYEPFMLTTRQFFSTNSASVRARARAIPLQKTIKKAKTTAATLLLIPGTITALFFILDFLTALVQSDPLPITIPTWLANFTFWLAIWGAMILWHETYRTIHPKTKALKCQNFSDEDKKNFEAGDLGLAKLTSANTLDLLKSDAEKLLFGAVSKDKIDIYRLFTKLASTPEGKTILDKMDMDNFTKELKKHGITEKTLPSYPLEAIRSILAYAAEEAVLTDSVLIRSEHLFITLFKVFPALNQYLKKRQENVELMRFIAQWIEMRRKRIQSTKFADPNVPYYRTGGIAQDWVYGYTYVLGHFSKDHTKEMARAGGKYGIGHDTEMEETLSILGKVSKNNVLLIGESGTGKTSIAKGLAGLINRGNVPPSVKDMRIIQLDINSMVASAQGKGNLEALIEKAMTELQKAGNVILFIDEIQEIIGVQGDESKHSLAGILLPYVLESKFPIIGTITYADYKRYFYSKESLRQSFQNVEVKEVSPESAFEIILTRLEELQHSYGIEITFPAILAAVELSQRYVYDRKLPDSAVNVMEASCASLEKSGKKILLPSHIAKTVSVQTEIPVEDVSTEEATDLLNLEAKIKSKVIGQDDAVHQVVEALKRARTGIRDPNRPIGTFLFLGPTGVGKTYLAKTVGEEYFGKKYKLVRLDMSEFKELSSTKRLLGSNEAASDSATTTTFLDMVKRHPFSVVLLDEIEKAHPQIMDLFLQVLDEGHMTNAKGELINFKNTIIICTSNIGSKTLLDSLEKDQSMFEEAKDRVLLELRQAIRVEFLNRFDQIIVFGPHTMANLAKIAGLLLKELKARLAEKEITLEWDDGIPMIIAQKGYQPGLGARPLRRFTQETVEGLIAERMLKGELKPGGTYRLTEEELESVKA